VAEGLAAKGHRGWLVGGCVRDLALGIRPKDVDLASDALPQQIESLFPRTLGVGRAFGTMIVCTPHGDVELTSFRSDSPTGDGRRPDQVSYGADLYEDAKRRDFTCNALYLDPLSGELVDPEHGLADLRQGRLSCVGDPRLRFGEDGLRLLRLARFAAGLGLEVEAATLAGARAAAARIDAVSGERKLAELARLAGLSRAVQGAQLLLDLGILNRILPVGPQAIGTLQRLRERPGSVLFLGALLAESALANRVEALGAVEALRPPRSLLRSLGDAWEVLSSLGNCLGQELPRSARILLYRHPGWEAGRLLWQASFGASASSEVRALERWQAEREALGPGGLRPALYLTSVDLKASGIAPGPRWGELLKTAERLQLDGEWPDPAAARAWLETET